MKILICANSYFSLCGCVVAQHGNLGKEYTAMIPPTSIIYVCLRIFL